MSSLNRHEGWIEIDHSASPGIPYSVARQMGYNDNQAKHMEGGKTLRMASLSCKHCGGSWIKNPDRIRPRGYCKQCDHYICDGCDAERASASYVHRSREEKLDSVMTSAHRGVVFDPAAPKPISIIVP